MVAFYRSDVIYLFGLHRSNDKKFCCTALVRERFLSFDLRSFGVALFRKLWGCVWTASESKDFLYFDCDPYLHYDCLCPLSYSTGAEIYSL